MTGSALGMASRYPLLTAAPALARFHPEAGGDARRAGGESDVLIGIEPANRAHQSQLALAGHIATRQATAWWVTVALQEYVLKHPARASDEHKLEPLIVGWGRRRPATGGAIGSMSGIAA